MTPGSIPEMAERWQQHQPQRRALAPLIGVFTPDVGDRNQWVHIRASKSLDQRAAGRETAGARSIWPPPGDNVVVRQETKILLPAPFSPIK